MRTTVPSPTLLSYLTTLSVVPEKYVQQVGDEKFAAKPIGSGPYVLASATAGSQVGCAPTRAGGGRSRRCARRCSAPCRTSPAASSTCSRARPTWPSTSRRTPPTRSNATRSWRSCPRRPSGSPTWRFNTIKGGATNDPRVRHAIALAIDYPALIKNLQRGYAKPVNSLLTPLAFGYDTKLPTNTYDPAQARNLISQANAKGATVVMATSPSFNPQIVQAIQADLGAWA